MSLLVSFDYGQTLAELDVELLAKRVAERGVEVAPQALVGASVPAWKAYNEAKRQGLGGRDAWCILMERWLETAGLSQQARPLAEWLWTEQPHENLWRRPIAGMLQLLQELQGAGVALAIVSNSEGRIAELLSELDLARYFGAIIDSGLFDFEKPDRRMFELAAQRLGGRVEDLIHIGDAWEADVVGALEAGARALWFAPFATDEARVLPAGVRACRNAAEVRRELVDLGLEL
jgi:HAD superfamily hydrolase (TIGR01549 family)